MKKALIVIDFVNDFVETDGKLTCGKPAQQIDGCISKIVGEFSKNGDYVITACDSHGRGYDYSPERKLFPEHCVKGTSGCDLYGETREAVKKVDGSQLVAIEKTRYSAFAGTSLDQKLRERGVTKICLTGVCSDICVLHTAIDAYNLGYGIVIYENGVASFNDGGHAFALDHAKNVLGADVLRFV